MPLKLCGAQQPVLVIVKPLQCGHGNGQGYKNRITHHVQRALLCRQQVRVGSQDHKEPSHQASSNPAKRGLKAAGGQGRGGAPGTVVAPADTVPFTHRWMNGKLSVM